MYKYWTLKEEKLIIELHPFMTVGEIAKELGRNEKSVSGRIRILRKRGLLIESKNKPWTDQEDAYLLKNRHKLTRIQMAIDLGRNWGAVRCRLCNLLKASSAVAA